MLKSAQDVQLLWWSTSSTGTSVNGQWVSLTEQLYIIIIFSNNWIVCLEFWVQLQPMLDFFFLTCGLLVPLCMRVIASLLGTAAHAFCKPSCHAILLSDSSTLAVSIPATWSLVSECLVCYLGRGELVRDLQSSLPSVTFWAVCICLALSPCSCRTQWSWASLQLGSCPCSGSSRHLL